MRISILLVVFVALIASAFVDASAQVKNFAVERRAPIVISDMPPLVVSGGDNLIEFVGVERVASDEAIIDVCRVFLASCSIDSSSATPITFTCTGSSRNCWIAFMRTIRAIGYRVSITPAVGGGVYSFSLTQRPRSGNIEGGDNPNPLF